MSAASHDQALGVAEAYRRFARVEARGRSVPYEVLAAAVADSEAVVGFLLTVPAGKRQPNLLFASARFLLGADPLCITALTEMVRDREVDLREVMLARRTQTNEPARCATLLPALCQLRPPLALIEVGASAGLSLLVDRYSYDFAGHRVVGNDTQAPTFHCRPSGPVPVPSTVPKVSWRAGLDLNPLDVAAEEDVRWLQCLVWPDEANRQRLLTAAISTARRDPPAIHRGDLLTDLPALAAQAPAEATLVIYHSAVLAYVSEEGRHQFAEVIEDLDATWLSNEAPGVTPDSDEHGHDPSGFILTRDRKSLALTDPHGTWLHWLA